MATQQVPVLYNSADECNAEGASMTAFYTLAAHRSAIRCVGGRFACWHLYNGVQRPLSVEQPALHSDSCSMSPELRRFIPVIRHFFSLCSSLRAVTYTDISDRLRGLRQWCIRLLGCMSTNQRVHYISLL